jgi:hypothetical protein
MSKTYLIRIVMLIVFFGYIDNSHFHLIPMTKINLDIYKQQM